LEYSVRNIQENQLVGDAGALNLLGDNTGTVNKNTGSLNYASEEAGLRVKIEKTRYILEGKRSLGRPR
jgi:hypothetical protein